MWVYYFWLDPIYCILWIHLVFLTIFPEDLENDHLFCLIIGTVVTYLHSLTLRVICHSTTRCVRAGETLIMLGRWCEDAVFGSEKIAAVFMKKCNTYAPMKHVWDPTWLIIPKHWLVTSQWENYVPSFHWVFFFHLFAYILLASEVGRS